MLIDSQQILRRLSGILDPELDESIVELGFIESAEFKQGCVTVELRLPTVWCSPNFAYMMAEDIRRTLLATDGVRQVAVRLQDHFAAEPIEAAVNAGKPFNEAFPDEASGDLDDLRLSFLRKGFLKRQERLIRSLIQTGFSSQEICAFCVGDLEIQDELCFLRHEDDRLSQIGPAAIGRRYLDRRAEIGLDCSTQAPLVTDATGARIGPNRLAEHLIQARTVRVSLDANASICCALLDQRKKAACGCLN